MPFTQWAAGQRVTAGQLAQISPKYTTFTPDWITSTGAHTPSFGNAQLACRWAQSGDLVTVNYSITFGSTTSFGSGTGSDNWQFGLPVGAASSSGPIGALALAAAADGSHLYGIAQLVDPQHFQIIIASGRVDATAVGSTGAVDAISPYTWASGNSIQGVLSYEAA